MPYVGDLAKGVAWTLEGLATGSSVSVMTFTKSERLANVELLIATEADPSRPGHAIARGAIWTNAARVSFAVSAPLSSTASLSPLLLTNGAQVYTVPQSTADTSIVGDAK